MDRIFDQMARVLASPMPRRKAFKLLGGALVGGLIAALRVEPVMAACTATSCGSGKQCCGGVSCRPSDEQCCGTTGLSCKSTAPCCTNCTNLAPFCKTPKKFCPNTVTTCP
jgi:hypothetical protein